MLEAVSTWKNEVAEGARGLVGGIGGEGCACLEGFSKVLHKL